MAKKVPTIPSLSELDFYASELGSATANRKRDRPSEFSAGAGLCAPEFIDNPPDEGGRWRGRTTGEYARKYAGRRID